MVSDRRSIQFRKTYSQIRKFSEALQKSISASFPVLGYNPLSESKRVEDAQDLFQKINPKAAQNSSLRNFLYNFLIFDDDDEKEK